jgi:hypothetical protein
MSVFGGLFHAKEAPGPIAFPVPATVPVAFRVYYVPGYPPLLPEDLRAKALGWIDAHAEEPLRSALKPIVGSPDFTYTDMAKTSFPPPLEVLTASTVGAEEKERLEKAWQVAVVACNTDLRVPMLGLWAAIAGGRSAAAELHGALFDAAARRLTPIASYESPLPGRGTLLVGDHALVGSSIDAHGLVRWFTTGLVKLGLPEVEVQEARPGVDLSPLVRALGQHLLDSVLTANHGREQPVTELTLGPEVEISLAGRAVRFRVMYTPGHGEAPAYVDVLPVIGFQGIQADFLATLV